MFAQIKYQVLVSKTVSVDQSGLNESLDLVIEGIFRKQKPIGPIYVLEEINEISHKQRLKHAESVQPEGTKTIRLTSSLTLCRCGGDVEGGKESTHTHTQLASSEIEGGMIIRLTGTFVCVCA